MRPLLLLACVVMGLRTEASLIFIDDFSYTNGILQTVSQQKWVGHSGATNEVDVTNGRVNLTGSETQDVNTLLPGGPFRSDSSAVLYASFKINFSARPGVTGSYFAHFKDSGTGFRARIWALAANGAAGHFRLGLTSQSASPADPVATNDLTLNTEYMVVLRLSVNDAVTTMWIDPQDENAPSLSTTSGTSINVAAFALRQSSGMGTLTLDDLRIGTQFSDVVPPTQLTITQQPLAQTIAAGGSATFSVSAVGPDLLSYQWLFNGDALANATNATFTIAGATLTNAGEYSVVIQDGPLSRTSDKVTLKVFTGDAPSISIQPESRAGKLDEPVAFYVSAVGTGPLTYQWLFNGINLPNATNVFYTVLSVANESAGDYSVIVENLFGSVTSEKAFLTIERPPPVNLSTNISYVRGLVDSINFRPPVSGDLFTVQGIVTTFTNMTSPPDQLFFMQDATAGIAVFAANVGSTPTAGDVVSVTGALADRDGLLVLTVDSTNVTQNITVLSSGAALPNPISLDLAWQNQPALIEGLESKLVIVSNVVFNLSPPNFGTNDENVTLTNRDGETINLHVEKGSDFSGKPKPIGVLNVIGILGQADNTDPRASGYEIIPRGVADFIFPPGPPEILFTNALRNLIRPGDAPTNVFAENSVRPGETITLSVFVTDHAGLNVNIMADTNGLPLSASWLISSNFPAITLMFSPAATDRGSNYIISMSADNGVSTNRFEWTVYVPTLPEENLVLTEFLANPTTSTNKALFNPLGRANPAPHPSSDDEFIELVNFSGEAIDLGDWTISDSTRLRHRFASSFSLASSNAIVVYGGPLSGSEPSPGIVGIPASEGVLGLGLNNTGDTINIRNANSNLVSRIVYSTVAADSSLTRVPDFNGEFVASSSVSTNVVSPGRNFDGSNFVAVIASVPPVITVTVSLAPMGMINLKWNTRTGSSYSVHESTNVDGPYHVVVSGLVIGQYSPPTQSSSDPGYYWISSP